jgi:hypothetical protein
VTLPQYIQEWHDYVRAEPQKYGKAIKQLVVLVEKILSTEGVVYEIFKRISNSYKNGGLKEWKTLGIRIVKILYDKDKNTLYNVLKFNNINCDFIIKDKENDKNIKIYNEYYKKIKKTNG